MMIELSPLAPPPPPPPSMLPSIFTIEVPFYFLQKEKLLPNISRTSGMEQKEEQEEQAGAEAEVEAEAEGVQVLHQMIERKEAMKQKLGLVEDRLIVRT